MKKDTIALFLLALFTAGFIYTYRMTELGFIWGLLNSACGAAMVGGLADWFAITALFHKIPLDSHSDILRNKRAELTDAIVDFATKDLLSAENIQEEVDKMPFSALIKNYLTDKKYRGREKVRRAVQTAGKSILSQLDFRAVLKKIEPDIRRNLQEGTVEKLIPKIGKVIVNSRHTEDFFKTAIMVGKDVYKQPEFQGMLLEHIKNLGENYDKKGLGRETVRDIFLDNDKILSMLNEFAEEKFDYAVNNSDELYKNIKSVADEFLQSPGFLEILVEKKEDLLANDDLVQWIYQKVDAYQKENRPEMLQMLDKLVNWSLDEFIANKEWQRKVNAFLKEQMNFAVAENHSSLGEIIRNKLSAYDDDKIVGIVKNAAGDDIHAIRISGSCVGAIAGAFLYVASAILERMWG